jgi:signal transduction histidine kinase/DNA-binding NarL/FixJ family response regulator
MSIARRISIRQLIGLLLVAAVVVAGLLFRVTSLQLDNSADRRDAQLDRADDLGLGTEVSTSADDLERMAQLYVATGDERYRRYHERILDIRAGEAPRPTGYDAGFWDQVVADGMGGVEVGRPAALLDLAREEELTAPELQRLREAIAASENVADVERGVMGVVAGAGGPSAAETERGHDRLASERYNDRRRRIADAVDEFDITVADRAAARVAELENRRDELLLARVVVLGVLGLVVALALFVISRWIAGPLRRLTGVTRRIAGGGYGQRTRPSGVSELNQLAVDFNEMADAIQSDIARRESAEHAAEAADRAKSEFLAVMSHELRTPMVGVSGTLDVLARTDLTDEQRELVQISQRSAASMLEIIGEVLDMSKIEAGKLTISPTTVSLRNVLEDVVTQYRQAASEGGLVLSLDVDPKLAAAHVVDPERVRQVLANLLSNAVKFTPSGRIEVAARVTGADDVAQSVEISVADSGIGIAPEDQAKLFQPFQQVDEGATRRIGGTGLGLVISREITERMGGELVLESAAGEGTTMRMRLDLPVGDPDTIPVEPEPATETAALPRPVPATPDDAERQGRLALLVEDHPVNRRVLGTQLEAIGFLAETAVDGVEGLARYGERDYAVVLADVHMPNLDGYELARRIREREAEAGTGRRPLVAVTASALHGELERCREAGMDDLITKPTTITVLADRLRRLLPGLPWSEQAAAEDAPSRPASTAAGDGEVLDRSVLEQMTGGDAALGESLLGEFVASAHVDVAAIEEALEAGDRERLRQQAHRIVGASRMVGAIALQRSTERLEARASAPDAVAAELRELADAVAAEADRVARAAA